MRCGTAFDFSLLAMRFRSTKDPEERMKIVKEYHQLAREVTLDEYLAFEDMLPSEHMPELKVYSNKKESFTMKYTVVAYLQAGVTYSFPARNCLIAREMSNRIITEGLWVMDPPGEPKGTELFFPTHLIAKVKVVPTDKAE